MIIIAYGLHSLMKLSKCIMQEDNEHDEYSVKDQLQQYIQEEDAHIKRDIKDKLIFLNKWHDLNVYLI